MDGGAEMIPDQREWLETDSRGGYAMGTVSGLRTRGYHGWLCTATEPPARRIMLVCGAEAWLETGDGRVSLSSHAYHPDVIHPDGWLRVTKFSHEPWPQWTLDDGERRIAWELYKEFHSGDTVVRWNLLAGEEADLHVRLLLAVRDHHALTRENAALRFEAHVLEGNVTWRPYVELPAITAATNGHYAHEPCWYRNFRYVEDQSRGLEGTEDLPSPGVFRFHLALGRPAVAVLRAGDACFSDASGVAVMYRAAETERRARDADMLARAAKHYIVTRHAGAGVIAGYPWFGEWGRDTFVALRGFRGVRGVEFFATSALLAWSDRIRDGLLPNRLSDGTHCDEYNTVDAPLWFVVAAGELLQEARVGAAEQERLRSAIRTVVEHFARGTGFGIGADPDGLIRAGHPGDALTWMDARVNGRPVTPRVGKAVEIQALWINCLAIAERFDPSWAEMRARASSSFGRRFVRADGSLFDVVDVDGVPGQVDASVRPNQIFAVGGLPLCVVTDSSARAIVDVVEKQLWTVAGLRTLAPNDPEYRGRYTGGPSARDQSYHQGSAWPWLLAAFVDAWLRVRAYSASAKSEAHVRFFDPLLAKLHERGLGHLFELADGDPPHAARGTPFQAWSVSELIRLRDLLSEAP